MRVKKKQQEKCFECDWSITLCHLMSWKNHKNRIRVIDCVSYRWDWWQMEPPYTSYKLWGGDNTNLPVALACLFYFLGGLEPYLYVLSFICVAVVVGSMVSCFVFWFMFLCALYGRVTYPHCVIFLLNGGFIREEWNVEVSASYMNWRGM